MANYRLEWRGAQTKEMAVDAIKSATTEIGGRWETAAKSSVRPGRGVVTGTYRRSLHFAGPDYSFGNDDVRASGGSPERSGQGGGAEQQGDKVKLTLGSGLHYAIHVENYYGVVEAAFDQVKGQFLGVLERHARARGLA